MTVVKLTLNGVGTGKKAEVTITFQVAEKVNAVADERLTSMYTAAGITASIVEGADNHLDANISANGTDLLTWLDAHTDKTNDTFDSVLSPLVNPANNNLWWGISVAVPDGATQADRYFSGATSPSPVSGAGFTSKCSNGRYQDWMTIATYDTTTHQWSLVSGAALSDTTRIVFKDAGGVELARADWTFNVSFN